MLISGPDPDWARQSAERTANAINLFLNLQERKRTDRENERQRHMMLLAEHPELADGDYGKMILKKYGGDDPLSSMVTTIRSRKQKEEEAFDSYRTFARAIGTEAGDDQAEGDAISRMDDTVPTFGNAGPGLFRFIPVPGPNKEKETRAAAFEQRPDVTERAFRRMTPEQRTALLTWQARHPGADPRELVKFAKGFDRTQLPADQQGARAIGASAADQRTIARGDAGLERKPADIAKDVADAAEKERVKGEERKYKEEQERQKRVQKEIDTHAAQGFAEHMQTRAQTFQQHLADQRSEDKAEGNKMPEGSPWKNKKEIATNRGLVAKAILDDGKKPKFLIPVNEQNSLNDVVFDVLNLPGYGAAKRDDVVRKVLDGYLEIKAHQPKGTPAKDIVAILKQHFQEAISAPPAGGR